MVSSEQKAHFTLNRYFSGLLTTFFLKSPITPNQITLLSLICGLLSGIGFAFGDYKLSIAAALLLQAAAILDNCDGDIARAKNMRSEFGGWFDVFADVMTDIALFTGLTIGVSRTMHTGTAIVLGGLCVVGSLFNFTVVCMEKLRGFGPAVFNRPSPQGVKRDTIIDKISDALREGDAAWFVLVFAVIGQLQALLWFSAFYMQIIWLSALFMNYRFLFGKPSAR